MGLTAAIRSFFQQAREVERQYGIPSSRQLVEALRLKREVPRFSLQDFFDFRLFEQTPEANARKPVIAGRRSQSFLEYALNDQRWKCLVDDKVVAYVLLRAAKVPIPTLTAVYTAQRRTVAGAECCSTAGEVEAYLRNAPPFPLFAKPIRGSVGQGAAAIVGYDPRSDALQFGNGSAVTVSVYVQSLVDPTRSKLAHAGYLFQEFIHQHPAMTAVVGQTVSTARMVVLVGDDERHLISAVWRIARKGNMTDNFDKGKTGNLLASVDPTSGLVQRVISGYGLTEKVLQKHPDTGAQLDGFQLPDWTRAVEMVTRGAATFPNLRFQHWDVAFSETGPVALEVNAMGGTHILQYASGKGLLVPPLTTFVERYGRSDSSR